jgi:hypothetical protein
MHDTWLMMGKQPKADVVSATERTKKKMDEASNEMTNDCDMALFEVNCVTALVSFQRARLSPCLHVKGLGRKTR